MNKDFFYMFTYAIHISIALVWVYIIGLMGLTLMILHWSLFNGWCFLSYIEQYIHVKYIGESRYNLPDYHESLFYKITKLF